MRLLKQGLVIALTTLILSGCGWSLRGAGMIPEGLTAMNVSSRDPNGELAKDLKDALENSGVEVPASSADADLSLVILQERSLVRVATVNENARVSEQELIEEAKFMITDKEGKQVIEPTKISVERIFEYDENNVLATQDERELIRSEMRRDLIMQMLNRLRQLK